MRVSVCLLAATATPAVGSLDMSIITYTSADGVRKPLLEDFRSRRTHTHARLANAERTEARVLRGFPGTDIIYTTYKQAALNEK